MTVSLVAEVGVHLRPVNRFVATGRPAGALLQPAGVVSVADQNLAVTGLLLEMALQAQICAALGQHFLVHRAVRRMAGDATFANRFMFKNKRPTLRGMTLQTGSVRAQHRDATAFYVLRQTR